MAQRGSIVPKGDGKNMVRIYLGTDPETKKRKYHNEVVKGSRKAAEQRLTEILAEQDKGTFVVPAKRLTLSLYLKDWMRGKEGEIRARTAYDYRGILKRYIHDPPKGYPQLQLFPLSKLEGKHFTKLFRHMAETCGLSHRTIAYLRTILSMALEDAVGARKLAQNPVKHAKIWKRRADGPTDRTGAGTRSAPYHRSRRTPCSRRRRNAAITRSGPCSC